MEIPCWIVRNVKGQLTPNFNTFTVHYAFRRGWLLLLEMVTIFCWKQTWDRCHAICFLWYFGIFFWLVMYGVKLSLHVPPDVSLGTTDRIQEISKTVLVITTDRKGIRAEVFFCLPQIRCVLMGICIRQWPLTASRGLGWCVWASDPC